MIPVDLAPRTSYQCSIVTIGLSHTVSEINGDFHQKLPIPPPLKGFPLDLGIGAGVKRNYNDGATR